MSKSIHGSKKECKTNDDCLAFSKSVLGRSNDLLCDSRGNGNKIAQVSGFVAGMSSTVGLHFAGAAATPFFPLAPAFLGLYK